jgi:hypothetical protein
VVVVVVVMVMFGDAGMQEALRPWLGKEVRDAELAALLRDQYANFVIGELVGGKRGGSEFTSISDFPTRLLIRIQVAARKAQVWGVEQRERRQSRPSLKRRVGDLDGEDWEVRSKERLLRSRRGVY